MTAPAFSVALDYTDDELAELAALLEGRLPKIRDVAPWAEWLQILAGAVLAGIVTAVAILYGTVRAAQGSIILMMAFWCFYAGAWSPRLMRTWLGPRWRRRWISLTWPDLPNASVRVTSSGVWLRRPDSRAFYARRTLGDITASERLIAIWIAPAAPLFLPIRNMTQEQSRQVIAMAQPADGSASMLVSTQGSG